MNKSKRFKILTDLLFDQLYTSIYVYNQQLDLLKKLYKEWKEDTKIVRKNPEFSSKLVSDFSLTDWRSLMLLVGNSLEQQLCRPLVLDIYGFIENSLLKLCRIYEEIVEAELKLSDIRGHGIIQSTRYLQCLGMKDIRNEKYDRLLAWSKVRNYLIHNGGEISGSDYNNKNKDIFLMRQVIQVNYDDCLEIYSLYIDFNAIENLITDVDEYLKYIEKRDTIFIGGGIDETDK